MTKEFRCKKCNYSFKGISMPPLCPNCGENESLYEEKSAQELIEGIE
jgi:rubrerythrin